MSTSWIVIVRRLALLFLAAAVLFGITMIFTYDIIKIQWPSMMPMSVSGTGVRMTSGSLNEPNCATTRM